ncbi:MAG: Rpn family recombination-promoting nuclease/putative transposase [Synechococcaceae cyanobacterium SM2_3_1]|nr:Rpn family recombination-promoting nuclease/putative transposase [Synechococcaceae cyanobacterium SM2_3_1]
MKTDSIFYALFLRLPELLFELLELDPSLAEHYEFRSVELKELARRVDGVLIPRSEFPQDPVMFVEVQSQGDEDLYWRLLTETFIYLNQYRPQGSWQAVVLWAKTTLDRGIPQVYRALQSQNLIRVIYLDQLPPGESVGLGILRVIGAREEEDAILQAQQVLAQARAEEEKELLELVERILVYKFATWSREELARMFSLTDWRQTQFYQDVLQEGKQEGREEGIHIGEERGELRAKEQIARNLIAAGLDPQLIAEATGLTLEQILALKFPKT